MKIIGFNFNKINVERLSDKFEKLKINTNVDLTDVKEVKPEVFKTKEDIVEIKFNYSVNYEPKIAQISLSGTVLVMADEKTTKSFLSHWRDKKLPDEHKILLFNVILKKSNLKAMQLEDELNLPLHVTLPSVKEIRKQ